MKKLSALLLAVTMSLSLLACGGSQNTPTDETAVETPTVSGAQTSTEESASGSVAADITLWTYPVGDFGDSAAVDNIVGAFNAVYPDINVIVEYLDYTSGDDQVTAAIEANTTPDLILEGPERLVANWGAKGKMVDLSDLWDEETKADILENSPAVEAACKTADGIYYEYPLCMTTHTMAINYEVFEQAGALQYINEDRTWTVENFEKALKAVKDSGLVQQTGIVYCGGQGGDQGTRALARNLYNARFTNEDHSEYIMNSPEGVKGLQQLVDWVNEGLLTSDAGLVASDEIQLFANGTTAMSFCWNASNQLTYAEQTAFTPYPVAFPSEDGVPELEGGIWGFGIFDNGDAAKIEAAKTFIKFVCDDPVQGPASVATTGFFPVRASFGNIYEGTEDEERMATYASFGQWLGDYYNVTPGWAEQRTEWWNLLQRIFAGGDVQTEADVYYENTAAATATAG